MAFASKTKEALLSYETANHLLDYDPQTGEIRWKVARNGAQFPAGILAGRIDRLGYRIIKVSGQAFKGHRIAWLLANGAWPDGLVDHINGNRGDNRIANLRLADHAQNGHSVGLRRNNTTGMTGVHKFFNRYRAIMSLGGRQVLLGSFSTKEEARAAYLAAAEDRFGEFANTDDRPSFEVEVKNIAPKRMRRPDLSAPLIRSLLDYDPATGFFTWRVSQANGRPAAGDLAGNKNSRGYIGVKIQGTAYLGHRLAWFWTYGKWPEGQVDHKNGDPSDNRIANLRIATPAQNRANSKLSKNNLIGLKGVSPSKKKWIATIYRDYKPIILGRFDTPEEAHAAYLKAAQEMHGEFARAS